MGVGVGPAKGHSISGENTIESIAHGFELMVVTEHSLPRIAVVRGGRKKRLQGDIMIGASSTQVGFGATALRPDLWA